MDIYEAIISVVREEMPDIGQFVVDKQLKDLGIEREGIKDSDVPRIIEAIVRVFLAFGEKKARRVRQELIRRTGANRTVASESDDHKKVHMLMDMGKAAFYSGDYAEALGNLGEALAIAEKRGFHRLTVDAAVETAQIEMRMKAFDRAKEHLRTAKRTAEEIYDRNGLLKVEYAFGAADWWSGDYESALTHFERAIREAEKSGDHHIAGMACMGAANVHSELGDPQMDIEYSERAKEHLEKAGDERELAKLYTNLGVPYEDIKKYDIAEKMYRKGLELSIKTNYRGMEAWALSNLSALYTNTGRFKEAEDAALKSMEIFDRMEDETGLAIAIGMLASLHMRAGDTEKAKEEYERAIELKRRVDSGFGLASSLEEYGELLIKTGEGAEGRARLSEAARIYRKIGNREKERECRSKM